MSQTETQQQTTPGSTRYGCKVPTESFAIESLIRYFSAKEAYDIWSEACKMANIDHQGRSLSIDELIQVARTMQAQGGLLSVVGTSVLIHAKAYTTTKGL